MEKETQNDDLYFQKNLVKFLDKYIKIPMVGYIQGYIQSDINDKEAQN